MGRRLSFLSLWLMGAALLLPRTAFAHPGHEHLPVRLPAADRWNLVIAAVLLLITLLYSLGLRVLWRNAAGRLTIRRWQAASFYAGVTTAAMALLSPLDRWSDILFSAHMAQHEVLMLITAPLMVLGQPFIVTLWSLSQGGRSAVASLMRAPALTSIWERMSGPLTVLVLHAAVLWLWHIPLLFEAALQNESIHTFQHLGFFLTAALFWWALVHGRYGRLGYGVAVCYVFATAMHTEILGALLTFGSFSWYPTHAARTAAAGINAVDDQHLAGIVMWVPFGAVFLFIGLALFAAWLGEAEKRVAFTTAERVSNEGRS